MKWIFKWLFRLFILTVALVVIFLLSYNSILRIVIQNRIRAETGMDAEIGKFSLGLFSPTIEIQNLKIYNPPNFGGTLFLDIPEIHVEYSRAALVKREIHITLMRFNLGEFDIVKNEAGKTNIFSFGISAPKKSGGTNVAVNFKKQTGYDFKGIDALNVSIGKLKYIDLKNPQNNRKQDIGIENCVMKNIKTSTDLQGLGLFVAMRSGDFFGPMVGQQTGVFRIFGGGLVF